VIVRLRDWAGSRRPLLRFVPQRRLGWLVVVSALPWALPGRVGLYLGAAVATVLAAAVLVDLLRLPSRAGMAIARDLPAVIGVGDTVHGHYTVANFSGRPLHVELTDLLPALLRRDGDSASRIVPALGDTVFAFTATGAARGRAALGPVGLRVTTRLGLVGARVLVEPADSVRVVPSVSGVRRYRLLAMQHRLQTVGVRQLRRKGEGRGFAGLREYAPGDDPRTIDWKATAKKAKVIVREFTVERSQSVFTVIDAGRSMTQLAGRFSRFEQALSAALVLTDIATSAGDRVGTLAFDDEVRAFVPADRSRGALQLVRDALTPVEASPREPDYAGAFRFLATHQRKRALVVLFTDVLDTRASQALIAHVARGAQRHLVLVVALRNDDIVAAARPRTDGSTALAWEAAAAEELIQSRDEALERMRRTGAVVLDVSPSEMTAAVVNRYLELKARGAI
jgi:uncharacterized protein (DUF58 family)